MKRWICLFLGVLLWTQTALAQDTVQPATIYVRSGPSETYNSIGALFQGDSVTPTNRSNDGTWILIEYGRGTGWIQQSEVAWQTNVTILPVLSADITPTARATQPLLLLSPTPAAAQGFVLVSEGSQAFVRSGPLRGYARIGQLNPGALVDPVSRNTAGDWILIRYSDAATNFNGFGWIARDLVQWRDESIIEALPIINDNNLTPTATEDKPAGPTPTEDASIMLASPTFTATTASSFATNTDIPTSTPITPTVTDIPPTLTETIAPTVTLNLPTATEMPTESPASPTVEPATLAPDTPTVQTVAQVVTNAPDASPATDEGRILPPPMTATPTVDLPTNTAVPTLTAPPAITEAPAEAGGGTSPALPLMGVAVLAVAGGLVYLGAFARAMPELRRYEQGFVRHDCPVCERGTLSLEEKRGSTLGVPSVRRTVRCNACRSVLREKGPHRWTYAVDRLENPTIYERYNGREITDDELKAL